MNIVSKQTIKRLKTSNIVKINKQNYKINHFTRTALTTQPASQSSITTNTWTSVINEYLKSTIEYANSALSKYVATNGGATSPAASAFLNTDKASSVASTTTTTQTEQQQFQLTPHTVPFKFVSRRGEINEKTRNLCKTIKKSASTLVKTNSLNTLNKHLYEYLDETRQIAVQENIVKHIKQIKTQTNDKQLIGLVNECLALLGYLDRPPKHRGVNILSLDGGGAKGFVSIEIMKKIEKKCGKRMHELFDYICGTSTGAILACLVGAYKLPLDECERYYKKIVKEIFERNTAVGIGKLLLSHAYYDTKYFENVLRDILGEVLLISSVRDESTPKIGVVSCCATSDQMKLFLFKNYTLPPHQQSHYDGTHKYCIWQAVRASSAAPGYYEEYKIEGNIFNDGGVIANNPTAIAIHECKQIWPKHPIQCVISIGTGRYQPNNLLLQTNSDPSLTIKQKLHRIVNGATSPENVHTVLHDLLPPKVYFRFNPYMSEEFYLDENRSDKWQAMQYDTHMYMRRNGYKFDMAAKQLLIPKTHIQNFVEMIM